ncbi:MAG: excinuclease ABC subunit UvrA [bacterium]|nr:excinuclease ABC subunit UvrA [bacterium]
MNKISIRGARENNLKNIDLDIPRNKVVCFVGVSGSGKSTIAFDIIAKEGQRQYFESLNAFARRYLQKSNKPDVDELRGISSTIIIDQERVKNNPRSTVGTLTEAYTYLRMLFSRVGLPSMDSSYFSFNHPNGACPRCKGLGRAVDIDLNKLIDWNKSLNEGAIQHSEWQIGTRMWKIIKATRYFNMDKKLKDFEAEERDLLFYSQRVMFQDNEQYGANRWSFQGLVTRLQERNSKVHRSTSERDLIYYTVVDCSECHGGRLNKKSLEVKLEGKNIGEVANLPLDECLEFVKGVIHPHAEVIKPRLIESLESLINVGIGYLSLNRSSDTLSGGEAQRVKFARQLGCDLIETIYVLDEPTAGLHPRDIEMVTNNLTRLRDKGNTVLIVEHDETVMRNADHIIEVGVGGGSKGGEIVAQGSLDEILTDINSLTGKYLRNGVRSRKEAYRKPTGAIKISNATRHNLKNLTLEVPTGMLVALTGVSGSGKSSLVEEILGQYGEKIVLVDQGSVGNNKRGCIGTYTGAFDSIRKIYARQFGMSESFFSFNAQGACDECQGLGFIDMDMNFLGDVKIHCEKCNGSRYKEKVLRYKYKDKNIAEVLKMTASETRDFFDSKDIKEKMDLLIEVGLDYVEIGQTLDTLSGGESQRLKLASRLQSKGEFYILDEPTSGLHFADIEKLMHLLNRLVDNGNTVLVVEHNLDVIKQADWVIDLGPEGGDGGGQVVAQGSPAEIAQVKESYTGKYLS